MGAVLLRFTDEKYVDSYLQGKLSFSALSSFWGISNRKAVADKQQDFSEGIGLDISKDFFKDTPDFYSHICNDIVRARIDAYGYCKILCFFRVDIDNWYIQQIPQGMFSFGNRVIIVKDEKELARRVRYAVKKHGEPCVIGDVKYRNMEFYDRRKPNNSIPHHATVLSEMPYFDLSIAKKYAKEKTYGCLDKYVRFAEQREFRICWLPRKHDHQRKVLDIGPADDLFDVVRADELNIYLLKKYPRHSFNYINPRKPVFDGNITYNTFKKRVEKITGKCTLILDIN